VCETVGCIQLTQSQMAGLCKKSNECSIFMQARSFLQAEDQLFEEESVPLRACFFLSDILFPHYL
jgi:hypothetical protein